MSESTDLGSLGQAARSNQLRSARVIMIIVGVLTIGANAFMAAMIEKNFQSELQQLKQEGMELDENQAFVFKVIQYGVAGVSIMLGVIFLVLGMMVYKFPIPCTIAALSLYVGAMIIFGLLDPMSFARGFIIKIFIIIGLAKSIKTAFAYEAERKQATLSSTGQPAHFA